MHFKAFASCLHVTINFNFAPELHLQYAYLGVTMLFELHADRLRLDYPVAADAAFGDEVPFTVSLGTVPPHVGGSRADVPLFLSSLHHDEKQWNLKPAVPVAKTCRACSRRRMNCCDIMLGG